jgi:hypothetical protein
MKVVISESQFYLIMETSSYIKRRTQVIKDALDHALSPNSVIRPEDSDGLDEYVEEVIIGINDELGYNSPKGYLTEDEYYELENYVMTYHWDEIVANYNRYLQHKLDNNY